MQNNNYGKREFKKATIRYQFMMALIEELETRPIASINVMDLCEKTGVSKVTFFNYFSSKEQVIEYFIQYLEYNVGYEITKQKIIGFDVVEYIVNRITSYPSVRNIMDAVNAYFAVQTTYQKMSFEEVDYWLFNNDAVLHHYAYKNLAEIVSGGLKAVMLDSVKREFVVRNFLTNLYGLATISKMQNTDLKQEYKTFISTLKNYI